MARLSLALVAALVLSQPSWSQGPRVGKSSLSIPQSPSTGAVCKVYALGEWTQDAGLCEWITKTIPQVVDAGEGKCFLSYYAPGKIMVVSHTTAGHAEIDSFLQKIKNSVGQSRPTAQKVPATDTSVVPAEYTTPSVFKVSDSSQPYPVAAPAKQPKHLFHFIIRYEGEGIIDSNVVEMFKGMNGVESKCSPSVPTATYSFGAPLAGRLPEAMPLTPPSCPETAPIPSSGLTPASATSYPANAFQSAPALSPMQRVAPMPPAQ